jgi:signal transduction histidine kinase/ligand-binding sensor domain-containing protein
MRRFGVWFVSLVLLWPRPAAGLDLRVQPFTVRLWPRPGGVFGIAQAPDGMLWFASATGVSRFDGQRFDDVDVGSEAWGRRVLVTADGTVWAATGNATLEFAERTGADIVALHAGPTAELVQIAPYLPPTAPERLRRVDGLPSPWVWALAEDREGAVWIGTEKGLARWAGGRMEQIRDQGLPASFITALAVGATGDLYVGTTAGVVVRRGQRFLPTAIHQPVLAVAEDRAGRLWATGSYQVLRADPDGRLQTFPLAKHEWLTVDHDDNVWTGRRVFAGGVPAVLASGDRDGYATTGALVDREGSVWLTVREGFVVQFQSPPVRNLGPAEGAPGRVAYSVLSARDGSIYAAGEGGLGRYSGGSWRIWREGAEVGWGPRDLAEGWPNRPNAGIWLAADRLSRGGPDGFHPLSITPAGLDLRSVVPTRDGDLWVSLDRGGLYRFPRSDASHPAERLAPAGGLCPGRLIHGLQARDGSIWFASSYDVVETQVTRIRDGRARCYGTADGLPPARIGAIAEDRQATIWLGTGWGGGLVRFRGERFSTVPASAGLPRASVTGILDDGRGAIWLCTVEGVWRVPRDELDRCADGPCPGLHATAFGKGEGMRNPECIGDFNPNLAVDQAGNVWAATLGGFAVFAPPQAAQRPQARPIIEAVAIDGLPVAGKGPVRLGSGHRELTVSYTTATFVGEGRPRLRHRLRGVDTDWVSAGSPAMAHYRSLAPGRYVLEIKAGEAAEAVTRLSILVEPPLWQTPRFLLTAIALLIAAALALHRARMARLRLQHRAVTEERARIARDLHDGLAQKLTAIKLLAEGTSQASPELERVRQVTGEAHAELRRAIWDMRETGTDAQRLENLLERTVSRLVVPRHITVKVETARSLLPVGGQALHEVPLIVREALTNAIRHAAPRNLEVGMVSDEEALQVWVRDDGCGLDPEAPADAGIIGMHERARRLGGTLTIRGVPGQGTEVSLFVPRDRVARGAR